MNCEWGNPRVDSEMSVVAVLFLSLNCAAELDKSGIEFVWFGFKLE